MTLDISENKLSGPIPNSLGDLRLLEVLNLESNNFTSESASSELIFITSLTNSRYLKELAVSYNPLNSILPVSVGNLSSLLHTVYASDCKIQGDKPNEIGNLSGLVSLYLYGNDLTGFIPLTLHDLWNLQRVSLGDNRLRGSIPNDLCKLKNLGAMYLDENQLRGPIPECLGNVPSLREIYLNSNNLSSGLPASIWNFQDLLELDLSSNSFSGSLSPRIGNLKVATSIDLSMNRFTGDIPSTIGELQRVNNFSLAYNRFKSPIPESMGSMLNLYKGILRDGTILAVKVFNTQQEGAWTAFDAECEVLRNLRHRNLIKVISSCSNQDFRALVVEYMLNGSLEKWLYSDNYFLDTMQRFNIMMDVASALEYLHHGYSTPVIHCDLKPVNVLLDENMVAHVSDFGITRFLGEEESITYTRTLDTLGYIAPEYGLEGMVSTRCDVYSYGITLLETFTRKRLSDDMFAGDMNIKNWVQKSMPDAISQVVDANLMRLVEKNEKQLSCLASVLELALSCLADSPGERMNMKDVVTELKKIELRIMAR